MWLYANDRYEITLLIHFTPISHLGYDSQNIDYNIPTYHSKSQFKKKKMFIGDITLLPRHYYFFNKKVFFKIIFVNKVKLHETI